MLTEILEIPIEELNEATWNANFMDEDTTTRLRESIKRYGLIQNLVVRKMSAGVYEVLSGNQRLKITREMGFLSVPCVVVELDDARARLLAQALNHIHGDDDLGLRADLIRNVLNTLPASEILDLLPETANSLNALASMGTQSVASYLTNWQRAQAARLRRLQFRLTVSQLEVVEKALTKIMPTINEVGFDNPNKRGNALYLICKNSLNMEENHE
jgi:ParB family chromosome partitioning protein